MAVFALSLASSQTRANDDTIFDVYHTIGDTEYFPLVETLDGYTITNSFDWRLDTLIEEKHNFLAYLEEGAGWSVTSYKVWPLPDGGAIAATSTASFEVEVMYPDTFVQFFARGPGDEWGEIDAPMPFVDTSDFLKRSPEPEGTEIRAILQSTDWAIYYDLSPETDHLTLRLTATNRDKCWPETIFGFATGNPAGEGEIDFCRDIYPALATALPFALDSETGRFELVQQNLALVDSSTDGNRCGPFNEQEAACSED